MEAFIPKLPTGQALVIFVVCMAIGSFVIIKYCLDQFDKPISSPDDKAPWKFVVPSFLTSRRQYLTGFAIYCSSIMLIFFIVSVVIGPGNFYFILKAVTAAITQVDLPTPGTLVESSLQTHPAFPIVVAFYIVGINPNLPKVLNFEEPVRRLAHRLAYIPKRMDGIFNYMRFSQFDLPDDKLTEAYLAAELRRPVENGDLKTILPMFNRAVLLYADAGTLAGDLTFAGADQLPQQLNMEVFKQYRPEIQNVGVNLQGISSRLSEVTDLSPSDRQKTIRTAQRDLGRNLELLYVIFACASTVQDTGRVSDRLRAIGFSSAFPPRSAIPWDPILRVIGAAAVVLFIAYEIAASTWLGADIKSNIPPNIPGILKLLVIILFIHAFAIGQGLNLRARLIASDRYFSETGKGTPIAFAKISLQAWVVSLLWYVVLNLDQFIVVLLAPRPADTAQSFAAMALLSYIQYYMIWALVPACCAAVTAYNIDRPSETLRDRTLSGAVQGLAMGMVAVVVVEWNFGGAAALSIQAFNLMVYGGLGCVVGFLLPFALSRYWRALEEQLPDQISLLRANVLQYFHDIQQFNEWLNAANAKLDKRRPLDLLAEDGGLQRLTTFASTTRQKVATVRV